MKVPLRALYLLALFLLTLTSCSQKIHPRSENSASLYVADRFMRVNVEPYINAMPGAKSENVIIPITFYLQTDQQGEAWPRKFKIAKMKVSGVAPQFYQNNKLDHNQWMHNSDQERYRNALRIPIDTMPYSFDITLWIKDSKGKKYRVDYYGLGAGEVY